MFRYENMSTTQKGAAKIRPTRKKAPAYNLDRLVKSRKISPALVDMALQHATDPAARGFFIPADNDEIHRWDRASRIDGRLLREWVANSLSNAAAETLGTIPRDEWEVELKAGFRIERTSGPVVQMEAVEIRCPVEAPIDISSRDAGRIVVKAAEAILHSVEMQSREYLAIYETRSKELENAATPSANATSRLEMRGWQWSLVEAAAALLQTTPMRFIRLALKHRSGFLHLLPDLGGKAATEVSADTFHVRRAVFIRSEDYNQLVQTGHQFGLKDPANEFVEDLIANTVEDLGSLPELFEALANRRRSLRRGKGGAE